MYKSRIKFCSLNIGLVWQRVDIEKGNVFFFFCIFNDFAFGFSIYEQPHLRLRIRDKVEIEK